MNDNTRSIAEIPFHVFTLIAHYISVVNFSQGIIFCDTWRIPAFFHPQATTLTPLDHLNPQLTAVEYYYCAKFQAIPIWGFHFIVLTYTPAHPRIN